MGRLKFEDNLGVSTILKDLQQQYQVDAPVPEENDLILIATVGLKRNTCCAEIKEKLKAFQDAEVKIRLVSKDDVSELQEIANACEILPQDGLVVKGKDFWNYNEQERMDKADNIC